MILLLCLILKKGRHRTSLKLNQNFPVLLKNYEVLVGKLLINLLLLLSNTDLFVQDATERRVTARHRSHLIEGNQVCKQ